MEGLGNVAALRVPTPPDHVEHAFYKLLVFVQPDLLRTDWSRDRVIHAIRERGVPCTYGVCAEIYRERAFDGLRPDARLPDASALHETSLMFLVDPTLGDADIDRAVDVACDVFREARR